MPLGTCPTTVDSSSGPRMAVPAMAPTTTLLTEMAGRAIPWVIPVTARSCSRVLQEHRIRIPPLSGSEILSWNGSP